METQTELTQHGNQDREMNEKTASEDKSEGEVGDEEEGACCAVTKTSVASRFTISKANMKAHSFGNSCKALANRIGSNCNACKLQTSRPSRPF